MNKKYTIIALVAVLLFAGFSYVIYDYNRNKDKDLDKNDNDGNVTDTTKPLTYVTISINPEIELAVNEAGNVEEVLPINEDADVITADLDLVGSSVEEASEKIVDAAVDTGCIDEYSDTNTVVVTTASDDTDEATRIQDKVMTKLNEHFESRKIYPILVAKGMSDDLKAQADTYNISNGKMLLIDYAVALNPTLSKDTLASSSIKDIQASIKTYVKTRHDALKKSFAEAKTEWLTKKQTLKRQYQDKITSLKNSITVEQKAAFRNMTPAEKNAAVQKILDARKAAIKDTVGKVRDELKSEVKEDMSGYKYPVLENNVSTIKENIKNRIEQRSSQKE